MPLPNGTVALNLGCGLSIAPGWINIDNSPNARLARSPWIRWTLWKLGILSDRLYSVAWSDSIKTHDLTKTLPYKDSSVDYVYTSHFLEHLELKDSHRLMSEVFRILKPGGIVRVVIPDLALGARQYIAALEANGGDADAANEFLNWLQLNRSGLRDPHLWMYDAASLSGMLSTIGFSDVIVCEYRKGRVPDCETLDNRPDDSLHIEARKS
ncbi:MAG TPA: methyltransferase domain-containing protein [Blastocatellia bacterium]|nr:methyltransferase domain-containing protein [Blastocatellia bacterium]